MSFFFFFFTATTDIYTLSLHDALPILQSRAVLRVNAISVRRQVERAASTDAPHALERRSEEHTSELQSPDHLVCRLLLEKKNSSAASRRSSSSCLNHCSNAWWLTKTYW